MTPLDEPTESPDYRSVVLAETEKVIMPLVYSGNRHMDSYLLQLPIEIRIQIWDALFMANGPIVVGDPPRMGFGTLAILRTCHSVHHEASIAFYHALCRRKIILKTYGAQSANLLKHHRKPLQSCGSSVLNSWFKLPCTFDILERNGIFESVVFCLGAKDSRLSVQRRWQFTVFLTALQGAPLKIRSLTIVCGENWKIPSFDERDLIISLFTGAFAFIEKIKFQGFSPDELGFLYQHLYMRSIVSAR